MIEIRCGQCNYDCEKPTPKNCRVLYFDECKYSYHDYSVNYWECQNLKMEEEEFEEVMDKQWCGTPKCKGFVTTIVFEELDPTYSGELSKEDV